MARAPWAPDALYDVAAAWVRRCLQDGRSLFSPGLEIWRPAVVAEAAEVIEAGGPGESDIQRGLLVRLPGRNNAVIQCVAELRLINLLPVHDIKAATKAAAINQILALMTEPIAIPDDIVAALDGGVAAYGSGKSHLARYMRFLAFFSREWVTLTEKKRSAILAAPWMFSEYVWTLHPDNIMQRDALLHLVFPDAFEYVIAPSDKDKLRAAFAAIPGVAAAANDDRALAVIRAELEDLTGGHINFYRHWLRSVWKEDESEAWKTTLQWAARLFQGSSGVPVGRFRPSDSAVSQGAQMELPRDPSRGLPFVHCTHAGVSRPRSERARRGVARKNVRERLSRSGDDKIGIYRAKIRKGHDPDPQEPTKSLFQSPRFDEDERAYKLMIGQGLAMARAALRSGDGDWLSLMKKAFQQGNNLTNWREHDPFLKWCEDDKPRASELLGKLWSDDEPTSERLAGAISMLPGALRPAARLSVVSFLLLGREVTRWPFYRQKIANRLKVITEGNATRPATPDDENLTEEAPSLEGEGSAAPYFEYRRLLDELRIRLATKGVNLRDRLDAQSLAWWLAEGPPPTQWDADEHQRFLDFQRNVLTEDSVLDDLPPTKAWLVRAARRTGEDAIGNRDVVKEFLEGGFVAIGWADVDAVSPGMDGMSIFHEVQQTYSERPLGWWRTSTGNLNSFVNRMEVGHLVVTVDKDKIFVGQVTAPYSFDINRPLGTTRRWGVAWFNPGTPASRKVIKVEHPGLYARLRSWLTVTELTEEIAAVESLIGLTPSAPDPHQPVELPTATEDLADGLHIPQDWLQTEVIDLLTEKKQVVFYGPPGTGKTLIAQRIAEHLTDDPEAFELVQFHPSYSYEDFFEGYRPIQTDTGFGIAYTLTHGPLRRLAERATANPSQPHVLIIDEINRGNVPKIFGELLFLLEYRDEQIPLMYSSESEGRFGLPKNLFIIATMNTADRSIALIDAALRRRFYFVPFMPREEPVSSVLTKWLDRHGHAQEAADLLRLLNDRIDSDDIAIGPSYFITTGGPPNLERIWRHSIMPLLEEHYFGTGRAVAMDFGLAALRTHLTATERDESGTVEEPEPSPG